MHRIHVVGHGLSEARIYPLRRKRSRYRSYQVRWYEQGEKQTKTLADPQSDPTPATGHIEVRVCR